MAWSAVGRLGNLPHEWERALPPADWQYIVLRAPTQNWRKIATKLGGLNGVQTHYGGPPHHNHWPHNKI